MRRGEGGGEPFDRSVVGGLVIYGGDQRGGFPLVKTLIEAAQIG